MPRPKSRPAPMPLFSEEFLQDACDRPKTEATYRTGLIIFQRFAETTKLTKPNTPLPPKQLATETLSAYYTWLRSTHRYRNASLRLYLVVAGQYLNWLEASGKLPDEVHASAMRAALDKKTGRRGRRVRPERRSSDDAVGALLAYYTARLAEAHPGDKRYHQHRLILLRNNALLHTLYATAGRVSEVLSLQRADVAEGRATQVEIVGKGGRRRLIFLTEPAQRAIQSYLRERTDTAPGLFVSHGPNKEHTISSQAAWQIVNRAAKNTFGTGPDGRPLRAVGPHAFRHLRAQQLSDEGMPITSLQALLGHASISTTRDIYAPKTPAQELLDEVSTYGRDPEDVIRDGEEAAEAIRQTRPSDH